MRRLAIHIVVSVWGLAALGPSRLEKKNVKHSKEFSHARNTMTAQAHCGSKKKRAVLFMVAEPRKRHTRSTSSTRRTGYLVLLLLLSGLVAGGAWWKEAELYGERRKAEPGPPKRRTWYSLEIQEDIRLVKTRKRLDRDYQLIIVETHYPHKVEVQYPQHWKLKPIQKVERTESGGEYPLPGGTQWLTSCVSRMAQSSEQSFAAAMQGLQTTLSQLVQSQRSAQWSKWVKSPETFKPESRSQELQMWDEWKFSSTHYIKAVDPEMGKLVDQVSANPKDDYGLGFMEESTKNMAIRLYGMLVTYIRGRPLQLIRHLGDSDGFKAWNILLKEMEPSTRQRSLALLTQLSRVTFV